MINSNIMTLTDNEFEAYTKGFEAGCMGSSYPDLEDDPYYKEGYLKGELKRMREDYD